MHYGEDSANRKGDESRQQSQGAEGLECGDLLETI